MGKEITDAVKNLKQRISDSVKWPTSIGHHQWTYTKTRNGRSLYSEVGRGGDHDQQEDSQVQSDVPFGAAERSV